MTVKASDPSHEQRQILRNSAVLAAARIIERATNLVMALLISRQLGVSALGAYATATAYFLLISVAGEAGVTNLIVREISKDRSRTNSLVSHACAIVTIASLVLMAAAWAIIPHLGYSAELRTGIAVIVLALLPLTLNTVQEGVFVAYQRVELQTWTTLGGSIVTVVASFLLLRGGHGVVSLLAVFVAAEYGVTVVYFVLINRCIHKLHVEFHRSIAREFLLDLRPFVASSVLAAAFARPEIIILSFVGSPAQVGYYSAAAKVVEVWQFLPQTYMVNVFPVLARSYAAGGRMVGDVLDRAIRNLLLVAFPISVGIAATAGPIVTTLYGPEFGPAVPVLRVLSVSVVLYCMHSVLWRILSARGQQGAVVRVQVVSLIVRLGVGYALILRYGALGAAITLPLSLALHNALLRFAVRSDGTRLAVVRNAWPYAVAAGVMGIAVLVAPSAVSLWGLIAIGVVVYGGALLALNRFYDSRVLMVNTPLSPNP